MTDQKGLHARLAAKVIETQFATPLSSERIAQQVGRQKRYLAVLFRQEFGMTMMQYLRNVRLSKAEDLIIFGEKIEAAIPSVGYHSKRAFYRHFRARTGCTPAEFRKRHP